MGASEHPGGGAVRLEPLALLIPEEHPFAALDVVPVAALEGVVIDVNLSGWMIVGGAAVEVGPFARVDRLHAPVPRSLARGRDAAPSRHGEHRRAALHLLRQGAPMVVCSDHVPVAGGVARPLIDPVPVLAWTIVGRPGADRTAVSALYRAAKELGRDKRWLLPPNPWLPQPEAGRLAAGER